MYVLGLNAVYHDSAACLVKDGMVVAAAEEERFNRVKHGKRPVPFSTYELPFGAVNYCLEEAGIGMADIDHVAYSYDPEPLLGELSREERITLPLEPSAVPTSKDWEEPWDPLFLSYIVNAPRQLVGAVPHHLQANFRGIRHDGPYQWHFVEHHLAHAASAFYPSPFTDAAVMTVDGRGERATTTYSMGVGDRLERLRQVDMPHSLGLLYERITEHLGFLHSSDEYKVMALASYGRPVYADAVRDMINVGDGGDYTVEIGDLSARFFSARRKGEPFEQRHFDLAESVQVVLEETVLELSRWLHRETGAENLCLAGGVALNCVMNSRIRDEGPFRNLWVQPAAGDAGTALGAALWKHAQIARNEEPEESAVTGSAAGAGPARPEPPNGGGGNGPDSRRGAVGDRTATLVRPATRPWVMDTALLGPAYGDDEIEQFLRWSKLPYRRLDDVAGETAELLARDRIIGWFQGRMEFGPRALGARSILASPLNEEMKERLNDIKDREDFRPVAPAVLREEAGEWFFGADYSPFMLFVYEVREDKVDRVPAVRHVDGTARIQTVGREQHPVYWELLRAFQERTGVPVLVNTSFNTRGEPIVCSPRDAIECFWASPLDDLVIGPFLVQKTADSGHRRGAEEFGMGSPGEAAHGSSGGNGDRAGEGR